MKLKSNVIFHTSSWAKQSYENHQSLYFGISFTMLSFKYKFYSSIHSYIFLFLFSQFTTLRLKQVIRHSIKLKGMGKTSRHRSCANHSLKSYINVTSHWITSCCVWWYFSDSQPFQQIHFTRVTLVDLWIIPR